MTDLRTFIVLDSLQPQIACFIGSTAKGFLPLAGQASLFVEIAPGIAINKLTDVALKTTHVQPAVQIVERAYGVLEIHADSQGQVRRAGEAILAELGLEEQDRFKPKIVSTQIIRKVDAHQAQLINRNRGGSMLIPDQTLFVMETWPAGYAIYAANEAEKAAEITIVEVRPFGAYGRIYLGGEEADIMVGSEAAVNAVNEISGTEQEG